MASAISSYACKNRVAKGSCRQAHARTRIGQTIHAGAGRPRPSPRPARPSGAWQGKVCKSARVFFLFLPSIASTMVAQLNYIIWSHSTESSNMGLKFPPYHAYMSGPFGLIRIIIWPKAQICQQLAQLASRLFHSAVWRNRCPVCVEPLVAQDCNSLLSI